jgi:hypothetical protein
MRTAQTWPMPFAVHPHHVAREMCHMHKDHELCSTLHVLACNFSRVSIIQESLPIQL